MSDLIKRSDAIDAINEYGSVWMEYTDAMTIDEIAERALKASKQSMVKILHDLPSAQPEVIACGDGELKSESQWIPCSERLPDKTGWYAVKVASSDDLRIVFGYESITVEQFDAWMELPTPWKESEE